MAKYRKKPVVVEAWPVRHLNNWASTDWYRLPQSIRDDYENPHPLGGWVFGALVETFVCANGHSQNKGVRFCSECGTPVETKSRRGICVPTLEGTLFADPDDYIIRGVQGEFYPCKPDIFHETYEVVE